MAGANSKSNSMQLSEINLENAVENPETDLVILKLETPFTIDSFKVNTVNLPNRLTPQLKRKKYFTIYTYFFENSFQPVFGYLVESNGVLLMH